MTDTESNATPNGAHAGLGLVGVLGGMGPLATVDFMHKVMVATNVTADQDHVPMVVSSIPQIPERTHAFRGTGPSPLPAMIASGRRLVAAGAGLIVMPCNTAHLWFEPLRDALATPMIHLVDAALDEVAAMAGTAGRIGLLATDATLESGLYVERRPAGLPALDWVLPTAAEMRGHVLPGIRAVKSGDLARAAELLAGAAEALRRRGADAIVLGCTEIPLVLDTARAGLPVIDATAALARRTVVWSRGAAGERLSRA